MISKLGSLYARSVGLPQLSGTTKIKRLGSRRYQRPGTTDTASSIGGCQSGEIPLQQHQVGQRCSRELVEGETSQLSRGEPLGGVQRRRFWITVVEQFGVVNSGEVPEICAALVEHAVLVTREISNDFSDQQRETTVVTSDPNGATCEILITVYATT